MEKIITTAKEFRLNNVYINKSIIEALDNLQSGGRNRLLNADEPLFLDNDGANSILLKLTKISDYFLEEWSEELRDRDKELEEMIALLATIKIFIKWFLVPADRLTEECTACSHLEN